MGYLTKGFSVAEHGLEIKADLEKRFIEGYAAIKGVLDSDQDVIVDGAFADTINNHFSPPDKSGFNRVRTLWQHDRFEPIGRPTELEEDSKGLYFKSPISATDVGEKALILVRDKVIDEMSFGYDVEQSERGEFTVGPEGGEQSSSVQATFLTKLGLWEVSPVTWGANNATTVDVAKQLKSLTKRIESGRELRGAELQEVMSLVEKHADAIDQLKQVVGRAIRESDHNPDQGEHGDSPSDPNSKSGEAELEQFGAFLDSLTLDTR